MRFRSNVRRWVGVVALGVVISAILSACDKSPSILSAEGPAARKEAGIAWMVFIICFVIFIGVTSVLLYSVFKFRARPNMPEPQQLHGNTKLEIAWTIAPTVVLFIIRAVTVSTMCALAQPKDPNTITVRAIGHQWWWEFQYNNGTVVTADEMHVPLNTVVHIDLVSDNVIHSFWVPQLTGKTDVIPGHNNTMWLEANKVGNYRGECAEFCGTQHAHMDFVVVAQTASDYQIWLAAQQNQAATPATGSVQEQGLAVFKANGCASCHQIDGVTPSGPKIGPNLTHFGARQLIAGGVLTNTTDNLTAWLHNAQTVKPGVDMPAFDGSASAQGYHDISPDQLSQLVQYLQSLQ